VRESPFGFFKNLHWGRTRLHQCATGGFWRCLYPAGLRVRTGAAQPCPTFLLHLTVSSLQGKKPAALRFFLRGMRAFLSNFGVATFVTALTQLPPRALNLQKITRPGRRIPPGGLPRAGRAWKWLWRRRGEISGDGLPWPTVLPRTPQASGGRSPATQPRMSVHKKDRLPLRPKSFRDGQSNLGRVDRPRKPQ